MEDRLKSHSSVFASMSKLVPPLVKRDEEDSEESSSEGTRDQFSVERVQSIGLSALQERLKEKLGSTNRKRKAEEVTDGGLSKRKEKKMEKPKKKKGQKSKPGIKKSTVNVPVRPSFVDESGRVIFSKFDFSSSAHKEIQSTEKKSKKKDYKKLLAKAEAAQKKLDELKKTDKKRGEELAKKLMWQKALDMARGTKVKDDPRKLKKTVKKIEKRKKKSSKEWVERKKLEKEAMDRHQAKRKANIEDRKEQIRSKKMKKRMKKTKGRTPGF